MTDEIVLYRCKECGNISTSLGFLHGQMERHFGLGPWNLIPDPRKTANYDFLMSKTEVIRVTDYDVVDGGRCGP